MIEIKHICSGYSGTEVLHDLNLTIKSGKVTVIIGPNGSGKSTLLKSLIRLNPHTSGDILIEDKKIDTFRSSMLAQKIAYIPQSRKTPDISVLRMVLHGRFPYLTYPRRYRKEDYEAAKNAMRPRLLPVQSSLLASLVPPLWSLLSLNCRKSRILLLRPMQ